MKSSYKIVTQREVVKLWEPQGDEGGDEGGDEEEDEGEEEGEDRREDGGEDEGRTKDGGKVWRGNWGEGKQI